MKNFNLILTSNGFINTSPRSQEIDTLFKKVAENKKVLLIVNATKTGSNTVSRQDVKVNFENVGASVVDTIEVDSKNLHTIFEYDVIYGMGGNVKPLLEDLQACNFRDNLIKFLKKGIYIGESAGSIILADDVKWLYDIKKGTKPKYDVVLNSYKGLGLTTKNIFPHFNAISEELKEKTRFYEKQNNIKITPLNDGEFILEYIKK